VEKPHRKRGIGRALVVEIVERMRAMSCDEVVLETELSNASALALYEGLGFTRDKRLSRYYLNGGDAYRLKLWFTVPSWVDPAPAAANSDADADANADVDANLNVAGGDAGGVGAGATAAGAAPSLAAEPKPSKRKGKKKGR